MVPSSFSLYSRSFLSRSSARSRWMASLRISRSVLRRWMAAIMRL